MRTHVSYVLPVGCFNSLLVMTVARKIEASGIFRLCMCSQKRQEALSGQAGQRFAPFKRAGAHAFVHHKKKNMEDAKGQQRKGINI